VTEQNGPTASATPVVAISGATSGIGLATAQHLAQQGWSVALGGRRKEKLAEEAYAIRSAGGKAVGIELDVRHGDSIEAFFDSLEESFGCATAAVNCAAHARPLPLVEMTAEEVSSEIGTSLIGSLLFSREALRRMIRTDCRGDVVFVSSTAAVLPWPFNTSYGAAKAGLEQASRALAQELEGTGIRSTFVRVGNTIGTGWADGWSDAERAVSADWMKRGLIRHASFMQASDVARTIEVVLDTPRGVHLEEVSVIPEAAKAND
jgi:NAD(P)-dependent dehydrogenase (short-subunit alcohol dehydrogenase family)